MQGMPAGSEASSITVELAIIFYRASSLNEPNLRAMTVAVKPQSRHQRKR